MSNNHNGNSIESQLRLFSPELFQWARNLHQDIGPDKLAFNIDTADRKGYLCVFCSDQNSARFVYDLAFEIEQTGLYRGLRIYIKDSIKDRHYDDVIFRFPADNPN